MSEGFRNFPASGQTADGWFDQFRQTCQNVRLEPDSQDASEFSSDEMLAFYRGELSEEQRRKLEAEALASPACFRKLVQLGTCVTDPAIEDEFNELVESEIWGEADLPPAKSVSSWVAALESSDVSVRAATDPPLELRRIVLNGQQQIRVDRPDDCVGGLVALELGAEDTTKSFAVCRRASSSGVAAVASVSNVPPEKPVRCVVRLVTPRDLQPSDAAILWEAFQTARRIDPASVSPIDGPRSPWEIWTEGIFLFAEARPGNVAPEIQEIAERIAAEFR